MPQINHPNHKVHFSISLESPQVLSLRTLTTDFYPNLKLVYNWDIGKVINGSLYVKKVITFTLVLRPFFRGRQSFRTLYKVLQVLGETVVRIKPIKQLVN